MMIALGCRAKAAVMLWAGSGIVVPALIAHLGVENPVGIIVPVFAAPHRLTTVSAGSNALRCAERRPCHEFENGEAFSPAHTDEPIATSTTGRVWTRAAHASHANDAMRKSASAPMAVVSGILLKLFLIVKPVAVLIS
jgi:hypothetical protein